MTTRKLYLIVVALSLGASINAVAQNSPLAITGSISSVKVGGKMTSTPINKNDVWEGLRWERKETWFEVSFYGQYCNRGEVTLIVPMNRSFPNQSKKILFLELPSSESKILAASSGFDLSGNRDLMPNFIKELEKPEPSPYLFATIEPGTCHSYGDLILVKSGYKFEERPGSNKFSQPIATAIPEHSYFKVQYSLAMPDSLPVSNAKRRWSSIGKLLSTSDGDFFLETEFIINKLPN
jgi:hypothetical protein